MSLKVVEPDELGLVCVASGSCRELGEVKEGLALGSVQWDDQGVDAGDGWPGRLPQICFTSLEGSGDMLNACLSVLVYEMRPSHPPWECLNT